MSARPAEIPCSSVRFISCNMICVKLRFNCLCVRHLTHMVFQLNLLAKASLTVAASSGCRMLGLMDLLVLVSRFQSLSLCIVNLHFTGCNLQLLVCFSCAMFQYPLGLGWFTCVLVIWQGLHIIYFFSVYFRWSWPEPSEVLPSYLFCATLHILHLHTFTICKRWWLIGSGSSACLILK